MVFLSLSDMFQAPLIILFIVGRAAVPPTDDKGLFSVDYHGSGSPFACQNVPVSASVRVSIRSSSPRAASSGSV